MKHILMMCVLLLSFYLGLYEGNLVIWEDGRKTPTMILPYKATLFPQEDQNRLKEGIPFESHDELYGLLEDFIS